MENKLRGITNMDLTSRVFEPKLKPIDEPEPIRLSAIPALIPSVRFPVVQRVTPVVHRPG